MLFHHLHLATGRNTEHLAWTNNPIEIEQPSTVGMDSHYTFIHHNTITTSGRMQYVTTYVLQGIMRAYVYDIRTHLQLLHFSKGFEWY